jgi:cyclohexanone monooxygenase
MSSAGAQSDRKSSVDAVIVGAGFSGLYQLHRFRDLGLSTRVFEAASGVGGTWWWNRYPGARCDIESLDYSYSFSPQLEQEWTWSEKYATQPEILAYIQHVAERFDLERDITFDTRVDSAEYDAEHQRWTITTDTGEVVDCRWFVMATGCLSMSKNPETPGVERFQGRTYHSGHWPHADVSFIGKRVAVIGTGSSGIQSIPLIARQAADTTVFQRTACYSMPARNRPLTDEEVHERKANYRAYRKEQQNSSFGVPVALPTRSALEVSKAERTAKYEAAWDQSSILAVLNSFTDTLVDLEANETAAEFVRAKIREKVQDPEIADLLSPHGFPYGTKRPCLDSGYYETFNKENVHLVDIRRTPLVEITEKGVRTSEQEYEVDAIVFATGFDAMTGAIERVDIRGKGGAALRDKWSEGPRSYLGLSVAGFPNMFTITGPSSPAVFSNMLVSIEQHVDWITDCVAWMRNNGVAEIDATAQAEDEWVRHVEEVSNMTLYPSANSWYIGANVPGKPRVFLAYIGGVNVYRAKCDDVAANGYEGYAKLPQR